MGRHAKYDGPERRDLTPEGLDRRSHFQIEEPKSWMAYALAYMTELPKPMLAVLALGGLIAVGQQAYAWKGSVDTHVKGSEVALQRLTAVETQVQTNVRDIASFGTELRAIRLDQLSYYRWMAEQVGDRAKAQEFETKLKLLEARQ